MKASLALCFLVLLGLVSLTQEIEISLPISEELFAKLGLSMRRLTAELKYFGTRYQNNYALWRRVRLTKRYLLELNEELAQYNNVIAGAANQVEGDANIIIGNYNDIEGSNNWVFISDFEGKIDGDLLVSEWRVEIDKSDLILYNPWEAISFLDEAKNEKMRKRFYNKRRSVCKWGNWAAPTGKNYDMWSGYEGYDQYVSDWSQYEQDQFDYTHHYSSGEELYSKEYYDGSGSGSGSDSGSYSSLSSYSGLQVHHSDDYSGYYYY